MSVDGLLVGGGLSCTSDVDDAGVTWLTWQGRTRRGGERQCLKATPKVVCVVKHAFGQARAGPERGVEHRRLRLRHQYTGRITIAAHCLVHAHTVTTDPRGYPAMTTSQWERGRGASD